MRDFLRQFDSLRTFIFQEQQYGNFLATFKLAAVVYKKSPILEYSFFLGDVTGYPAIWTEYLGKTQIYLTDLDNTVMNEKNSTGYSRIQERNEKN